MTANERISKAKGEKYYSRRMATLSLNRGITSDNLSPQYETDPAAWSPEHYQWIEDEGLKNYFTHQLWIELVKRGKKNMEFEFTKATPLHNATALDRALKERDVHLRPY